MSDARKRCIVPFFYRPKSDNQLFDCSFNLNLTASLYFFATCTSSLFSGFYDE